MDAFICGDVQVHIHFQHWVSIIKTKSLNEMKRYFLTMLTISFSWYTPIEGCIKQ